MTLPDSMRELLMKYLDGQTTAEENAEVERLLCHDELVRDFLREVAEQAIMIADLERMAGSPDHLRLAEKVRNSVSNSLWKTLPNQIHQA